MSLQIWRPHLRSRSELIAQRLLDSCVSSEEDQNRIASTGDILPERSLKFRRTRSRLLWVLNLCSHERFFTYKRVLKAVEIMKRQHNFRLPDIPGFEEGTWVKDQARILVKVLQRARKLTSPRAMDNAETQAYTEEEIESIMRGFLTCEV